ncbi:MAG: hypothetical protein V4574_08105 [Pseudomonadota bacterium]
MLGLSIPEVAGRARSGRDAAANALIARMTSAPGEARAGLIDALVRGLKDAGVWAKLDLLYLLAAHDAQAARLNWVEAAHDLTAVNSPGFTVDRGYAGDGTASYLDTGWAPSGAVHFVQDSAALGCWLNAGTDTGSDFAVAMGARDASNGAFVGPRGTANAIRGRVNQAASSASSGSVATRLGFTALSRTASNLVSCYRGASLNGGFATASSGRATVSLYLGCLNASAAFSNGCDNRIAAAFAGAGLNAGEVAALHAALSAYLTGIGAA